MAVERDCSRYLKNSYNACKVSLGSQAKMVSKCNRIASLVILNYKIFLGEVPKTPPLVLPPLMPSALGDHKRCSMAVPLFKSRRRPWLKEELDCMESKQIICKVTEPTSWVNSLVCVEKPNGKIRICLDPKALNDNIRRPHYPMRSIDDITAKLAGAKYFSVLDATKGYWSICLDQESSFLTTFNTPFGRYRYLRLPMGIRSSQDIFQRKVDEMLEGLLGVG